MTVSKREITLLNSQTFQNSYRNSLPYIQLDHSVPQLEMQLFPNVPIEPKFQVFVHNVVEGVLCVCGVLALVREKILRVGDTDVPNIVHEHRLPGKSPILRKDHSFRHTQLTP